MSSFRRVDGARAGSSALGILVPPGRRTMMIVRPRGLDWDLLPLGAGKESGTRVTFQEQSRDVAARQAQALFRALEAGQGAAAGEVRVIPLVDGGFAVEARIGGVLLLACRRVPGQAYRPILFPTLDEAREAARRTGAVFSPAAGTVQEVYFNTQSFSP
jgi:hypothetical protein